MVGSRSFSRAYIKFRTGPGFLISLTVFWGGWVALNLSPWWHPFDIYPFVLLNLVLSIEASYVFPMMVHEQARTDAELHEILRTIMKGVRDIEKELEDENG